MSAQSSSPLPFLKEVASELVDAPFLLPDGDGRRRPEAPPAFPREFLSACVPLVAEDNPNLSPCSRVSDTDSLGSKNSSSDLDLPFSDECSLKAPRTVRTADSWNHGRCKDTSSIPSHSTTDDPSFCPPDKAAMSQSAYYLADKVKLSRALATTLEHFHSVRSEALVADLVRNARDKSPVWKELYNKHGIFVDRRKVEGAAAGVVRGSIDLSLESLSVRDIMSIVWSSSQASYNNMAEYSSRLCTWKEGWPATCAFYLSFYGQFGFPGRDFVMAASLKDLGPDHAATIIESISHPELDRVPSVMLRGRVRAWAPIGGYEARRLPDGRIRLTAVWSFDLKSAVCPDFILRQLQVKSVLHLQNLGAIFAKADR
uniref:START domain-containing protein n=1 Tax=Chromera velia CCMP2878 TaxID=1169474 RepID=A0A0G4F3B1_9ALVE|eukprot:Cvel_14868.t1-p1 / transcript=Cvel_14868.t1 / gene=Cvel_14868 / organism=Chromera_velia_CCMP2878 / gene_product=hypothetical protein / transcript_product=hypothetical protein / location=Cvel_scaffold1075:26005-28663(-) / protein_length=370 / sequence_SO=supercontig / SO=protein_coding / is_pseudo=false